MSIFSENCTFIIPARLGSKGLPFKNRDLVPILLRSISSVPNKIIVTTDDTSIIEHLEKTSKENVIARTRPPELALDDTSMKDTILDVIDYYNIEGDLIILYPTYPERSLADIQDVYDFYIENNLKSTLCSKETRTHPYMCLQKVGKIHAKPIFNHDLYRRQDYPSCFEISHFVVVIDCKEVSSVNSQMYNGKTGFYNIEDKIDVDYKKDYDLFKKGGA